MTRIASKTRKGYYHNSQYARTEIENGAPPESVVRILKQERPNRTTYTLEVLNDAHMTGWLRRRHNPEWINAAFYANSGLCCERNPKTCCVQTFNNLQDATAAMNDYIGELTPPTITVVT